MALESTTENGVTRLAIQDELSIYTATQMKKELVDALSHADECELSLEHVSEIDTAGVQLLLFLRNYAKQAEKHLSYVHHSDAVIAAFERLNLIAHFGDPIIMPAGENKS